MSPNYYIVDNFLDDPDALVEETKSMEFSTDLEGKHFDRTLGQPSLYQDYKKIFGEIIGVKVRNNYRWSDIGMNCSFYRTYPGATPKHIHHDWTDWSGILYLSKDIPEEMGTQLWKHTATGSKFAHNIGQGMDKGFPYDDTADREGTKAFTKLKYIPYKYNRLALFRGTSWHSACLTASMPNKSRLNQFFYFDQERWNNA